jgi:hypothetical protein
MGTEELTPAELAIIAQYRAAQGEPAAAPADEEKQPARVLVKPPAESRLETLLCEFEVKQAAAKQADDAFKELKSAILAELRSLYPGKTAPTEAYDIPGTRMYPSIVFSFKSQPYLPTGKIKDYLPAVYEAFRANKTYWQCEKAKS